MKFLVVKRCQTTVPRSFLRNWLNSLQRNLPARDRARLRNRELTLVFLNKHQARKLNSEFRGIDYATDVLSFDGHSESLGDLVLCPEVLRAQAREHGLGYRAELGYMLIHGVLHLLGYDHEKGQSAAQRMFRLQDRIFLKLCKLHLES